MKKNEINIKDSNLDSNKNKDKASRSKTRQTNNILPLRERLKKETMLLQYY